MKTVEKIYKEHGGEAEYFTSYYAFINDLLNDLDPGSISAVIKCFLEARQNGKIIYFAGNGGSASTASHFAQDLGEVGRKADVPCFKTLSLNDNVSLCSAIANDYGYDKVFSIPVRQIFNKGDVLVVISASGNSPNVIAAVEEANKMGATTVGLVGFDGGRLAKICDLVVHVKSEKGQYGPVEDVHMILDHMITSYLIEDFRSEKRKK